jgi:hypothetical protein
MLTPEDRRAIEGLFERLREVAHNNPDRDREAEALIQQEGSRSPGAGYYMAQTILVQEQALDAAQRRIAELEEQSSSNRGGFFDSIFGDGGRQNPRGGRAMQAPRNASSEAGPWDRQRGGGGGFLAGAAQTAIGVTGGVLLGSAIASMFGGGEANAAEAPSEDQGGDDGGDAGGDFDLGGDF